MHHTKARNIRKCRQHSIIVLKRGISGPTMCKFYRTLPLLWARGTQLLQCPQYCYVNSIATKSKCTDLSNYDMLRIVHSRGCRLKHKSATAMHRSVHAAGWKERARKILWPTGSSHWHSSLAQWTPATDCADVELSWGLAEAQINLSLRVQTDPSFLKAVQQAITPMTDALVQISPPKSPSCARSTSLNGKLLLTCENVLLKGSPLTSMLCSVGAFVHVTPVLGTGRNHVELLRFFYDMAHTLCLYCDIFNTCVESLSFMIVLAAKFVFFDDRNRDSESRLWFFQHRTGSVGGHMRTKWRERK